jgi:uncharacterized protein DUF6335
MPAKKKAKKPASKASKKKKPGTAKKATSKAKKVTTKKSKTLSSKKKVASKKKLATTKKAKTSGKPSGAKKKKRATVTRRKPEIQLASEPQFIDAGRLETEIYEPDPEVKGEFAEAAVLGDPSRRSLLDEIRENSPAESPVLSGGDLDAAWDQSDASGEETVGGSNPTPDQDVVDELGKAVGLTYQNNEPLDTEEKISERDRQRWELEPESSEDYQDRE